MDISKYRYKPRVYDVNLSVPMTKEMKEKLRWTKETYDVEPCGWIRDLIQEYLPQFIEELAVRQAIEAKRA